MESTLIVFGQIISGLAPVLQVVLLIILAIIFRDPILQFLGLSSKPESEGLETDPAILQLNASLAELARYANHETTEHTEILRQIRDTLKEGFAATHSKHAEWDKFGIPTRECQRRNN